MNIKVKLMIMAAVIGISSCGPKYPKPTEGSDVGFALSFFQKVTRISWYPHIVPVSPCRCLQKVLKDRLGQNLTML